MDSVALNIYAGKNNWALIKRRRWPNAGGADLDRIKQAFRDAFHGTGQPVFAEGDGRHGHLLVALLEELTELDQACPGHGHAIPTHDVLRYSSLSDSIGAPATARALSP